jgi:NAD(P)-dependent dehydrogenase (short-subunit alcohol dehydrogenase family)
MKTILITGATKGLGEALLREFARLGHTLIGCGRDAERVAALSREFPSPHRFSVVDCADETAVAGWAAEIEQTKLVPDLLINNAALIHPEAPLWEIDGATFSKVVDVNIKGVANVIRHFVPAMVERRRGIIVNMSSGWGRSVDAGFSLYCATKWAIEGLSKALAEDLPEGMASIPLSPGIIDTPMLRTAFGESAGQYEKPAVWAKRAVPKILSYGTRENGQSLSI